MPEQDRLCPQLKERETRFALHFSAFKPLNTPRSYYMAPELHIGTRLQVDKQCATVRYLGKVAGQEGLWAGLDWDDDSRGKHDGSHEGRQYFTCLSGQRSGSFVRQNKLMAVADLGTTLPEALADR